MQVLKHLPKFEKAAREGIKRAKDLIRGKNKSSNGKGKSGRDDKEQEQKESQQPKQNQEPRELKDDWRETIDAEREGGINQDVGKARGRSLGDLDKIENAPTSLPGKELNDTQGKVEELGEKVSDKEEAAQDKGDAEHSFEERVGDKKIEQILEEGQPKSGRSWVDKVRPEKNELEFQEVESELDQSKAIELMKEESSQFMMPEGEQQFEPVLTSDEQQKAIELMGDGSQNNDYKIDAYKATIKSTEEIDAIKEDNFFDSVYRDEWADEMMDAESAEEFGEDGGDAIDFDFD